VTKYREDNGSSHKEADRSPLKNSTMSNLTKDNYITPSNFASPLLDKNIQDRYNDKFEKT
jgi:hypothetical protein